MKTFRIFLALLLAVALSNLVVAQHKVTTEDAKKWAAKRAWAKGSTPKLSPSVDYIEFAKQYHANKRYWTEAIAFLSDKKLDTLKPGKYIIDGDNVYAMVTDAPSKEFDKSAWESHKNYIDLHYLIKGEEKIGVAPVATATVVNQYDAVKDVANYNAEGKYYIAGPGEFFLFFPGDVHRPNIKVDGYDSVKKLVIKIRYTSPGQ